MKNKLTNTLKKALIYAYVPVGFAMPQIALPNISASVMQPQANVLPVTGSTVEAKDKADVIGQTVEEPYQLPFSGGDLTTRFSGYHPGIDLAITLGTPIKPIMKGKVVTADYEDGYGRTVVIEHNNGIRSRYAHLTKINVAVDQEVTYDTIIGTVGSTGHSTGPHLHLEIYENGQAINPLNVLPLQ